MELDSLYESFANLNIHDTQSPKAKPYGQETQLWMQFNEILKKHDLEDFPIKMMWHQK